MSTAKQQLDKLLTLTGFKIGLFTTLLCLIIYAIGFRIFNLMELKVFDVHLLSRGKVKPGNEVVIVAIDEKSLKRFGRWPWPRKRIAELVMKLKRTGARVIAFDIIFSEPEESSAIKLIRDSKNMLQDKCEGSLSIIESVEKKADNDAMLAVALKNSPSVVLGYFFFTSTDDIRLYGNTKEDSHSLPSKQLALTKRQYINASRYSSIRYIGQETSQLEILRATDVQENIPLITTAVENIGYLNIVPDPDGTVRWVPLAMKYKDDFYPHFSLVVLRQYLGSPPLVLNIAGYGVESMNIGNKVIPTDEKGRLLINFRGPQKTFPHYSFSDVIDGTVPGGALKDKVVLVGATAVGIYDMRVTPLASIFPGVEIHANIIDTILHEDFIHRPGWAVVFDILFMASIGVLLSSLIPRMSSLYTSILIFSCIVFYIFANDYVFRAWGIWLTEVYSLMTIIFVSGGVTFYQFMTEEREKRKIGEAFSHYVAPSLVQEILKDPKRLILGGEEKRLTVLFSDIRDFTAVSESLAPQALVKLINDYLTPMTNIVLKNGGTIDKYMGDAIMAFWGAPVWEEDHAARACQAALEMLNKLKELQLVWQRHCIPKLDIGVGMSTGRVTVGNMGSITRFDYTVMGDSVNLGSRLEGLNKEYDTHIIVPKYTYEDVKERFVLRALDLVKVKGKNIPIMIYELLGDRSGSSLIKEIAEIFGAGFAAYRVKQWDKAEAHFRDVLKLKPDDGPSKIFIQRITALRTIDLPSEWDGVYTMTKK